MSKLLNIFNEDILNRVVKFVLLFLSCFFVSCYRMDNEQKTYPVRIEKVNNLINVINPGFPKIPPRKFILKEEFSIGNDSDENYLFLKIRKLGMDNKMNLYVLDSKKCRIQVFDKQGIFVRSIGRGPGNGPGEMGNPIDLIIDEKNDLVHILDNKNRKIIRYHLSGIYDTEIKLIDGSPDLLFLDIHGSYIIVYSFLSNEGFQQNKIITYTLAGKRQPNMREFISSKSKAIDLNSGLTIGVSIPFNPKGYYAYSQEGYLYYGFSDRYELIVLDEFLKIIKIIKKRDAEKIRISQQEIEMVNQELRKQFNRKGITSNIKIDFPDFHQLFTAIWVDNNSRILLENHTTNDEAQIDVFNNEGIYVEKMIVAKPNDGTALKWIFYRPLFNNDCIYAVVINDDDVLLVKKYRFIEKI